jgi:hypothetical protein
MFQFPVEAFPAGGEALHHEERRHGGQQRRQQGGQIKPAQAFAGHLPTPAAQPKPGQAQDHK